MNYLNHYNNLINQAKHRQLEKNIYTENHHIIPRCMGGTDDKTNLVKLLPEEHFVAHQLLVKIYPNRQELIYAVAMMCVFSEFNKGRSKNKLFGWLRRKFSQTVKERQTGNGNSQFGTMWIHNNDLKVTKKIKRLDTIPGGWTMGRVIDFNKLMEDQLKENQLKENKRIKKEEIFNIKKQYAEDLYKIYKDNQVNSLRNFCKLGYYDKSHVSLYKLWKKYLIHFE